MLRERERERERNASLLESDKEKNGEKVEELQASVRRSQRNKGEAFFLFRFGSVRTLYPARAPSLARIAALPPGDRASEDLCHLTEVLRSPLDGLSERGGEGATPLAKGVDCLLLSLSHQLGSARLSSPRPRARRSP